MRTLIFCLILFTASHIEAQTSMVVTYTNGKVYYYGPQTDNATEVYPGVTLSSEGRLKCAKDARVKLLCHGKVFEFNDTKVHFLEEVAREANNTSTLSFMGRFWMFLTGSMEGSENEQHLDEHNKQSMENLHAGVKGYAIKDFEIQTDLIYEGKLSGGDVTFTWEAPENLHCCFKLTRQTDDSVVLSIWTSGDQLRLNMSEIALADGGVYEWQVITDEKNSNAPHSRKMQFTYQPQTAARALANASSQAAFKSASDVEQQLMKAFALEENGFYYDAGNCYKELSARNPEDVLVKRAYAAFLARVDQMDEARALIK